MTGSTLTRRDGIAGGLALLVAGCGGGSSRGSPVQVTPTPSVPASPAPATPTPALTGVQAAATPKQMRFGSAVAWNATNPDSGSFQNPRYAALLERDCGVLVAENELKWQAIRPSATGYDFARFDEMLAWGEARGKRMRGHTLLWYVEERFPGWLRTYDYGASPATEAERLIVEHVATVCRRYGPRIYSYDVINEAVDPDSGGLRRHGLSRATADGTALLDAAFRTARAETPAGTQLVYNDYMDWGGRSTHRDGVLALLRGFRERDVPVDALGIQGHIGLYSRDPVEAIVAARRPAWQAFLTEVTALGYDLVLTEIDVNDDDQIGAFDIATRDARAKALARGYLDIAMAFPQLRDVLVWGMVDRFNWIQNAARTRRPTPHDLDYREKPMREAFVEAFAATTARPAPPARPA